MSPETTKYKIRFENLDTSERKIHVVVEKGSPLGKPLDIGEIWKEDFTPVNGILKFRIDPIGASNNARLHTHKFSTKHDFQFSKQKKEKEKKWELTLDVGNQSGQPPISTTDDPPTNVEVGVDEPGKKKKQKPKGK